jgi:DnaJ-class molecular chaperone
MARPANPGEVRAIKALRDAKAITAAEQDAALAALEATTLCDKCNGSGNSQPPDMPPWCNKCDSTGQMRVIR